MPSEELIQEIEQAAEQITAEPASGEVKDQGAEETGAEQDGAEEVVVDDSKTDDITSEETEDDEGDTGEEKVETEEQESEDEDDTSLPSVPELSDEVIGRAIGAGMTLTDALSFPNEAALNRVVTTVERTRQVESQKKDADDAATEDPFANLKLDPEKYEPEIIEAFEKMTSVLKGQQEQIQTFKQQQEEISQATEQVAAQDVERWFDGQVEGLGKDFVDALGEGGYSSLDRGSSQFKNRDAIASQVSILLAGYKAQGLEAPPREDVFSASARLVLADKYQELHEKRLAGDLAKQSGQHIQRAGGSKAKSTKSAEEETATLLDERFGV